LQRSTPGEPAEASPPPDDSKPQATAFLAVDDFTFSLSPEALKPPPSLTPFAGRLGTQAGTARRHETSQTAASPLHGAHGSEEPPQRPNAESTASLGWPPPPGRPQMVSRETQTIESELAPSAPARRYIGLNSAAGSEAAEGGGAGRRRPRGAPPKPGDDSSGEEDAEDSWLGWWAKSRLC
jgi:hypothetical protein